MKSRRQWYHRDMLSYLPYILHQANTDKGHVQCICANNHRVAAPRCLKPFISSCYRRTQLSLVFLSLQIYKQTTIVVPYHVLPWQHRISKQVGYPPDPAHNYIHPADNDNLRFAIHLRNGRGSDICWEYFLPEGFIPINLMISHGGQSVVGNHGYLVQPSLLISAVTGSITPPTPGTSI